MKKYNYEYIDEINRGSCQAVFGSMTRTINAQNILADAAIRSDIIKLSQSSGVRGCVYGLSYSCAQAGNVTTVLSNAGVSVKRFLDGNDS